MSVVLVTLSNAVFEASRRRLEASARAHGIDDVVSLDFDTLAHHPFFIEHATIMRDARGMGYWLWKPFIISKTLAERPDGTTLVYLDAGMEILGEMHPVLDLCTDTHPVLLFGNGVDTNARWTRRDTFVLMGCDTPAFWEGPHCDASTIVLRKTERATAFVGEWLSFCCKPAILTDAPNVAGLPNLPAFQDHRHDQSVLSLLAQKHCIDLHRMPSQFGNHYKTYPFRVAGEFNCSSQWDQRQLDHYGPLPYHNSPYGQLLNHHRTKAVAPQPPLDMSLSARLRRRLRRESERFVSR